MEMFLNIVSMIVIIAFVIMLPYALIIINIKLADNYKSKTSLNNKLIKTVLLIPPIGILVCLINDLIFDIKQYLS